MHARTTLMIAAIAGFLAVALGAFGAHGLKNLVSADMLKVYQTGVQYHLVHATVLLGLGVWQAVNRQAAVAIWLSRASWLMIIGLLLFSGSLYLLTMTGIRPLGIITPFGGTSWLAGWVCVLLAARQLPRQQNS